MFTAINETIAAARRVAVLFTRYQVRVLCVAIFLMLFTGALTTVPALVVGALVDDMLAGTYATIAPAIPYLGGMLIVVVIRELLTVVRKWVVEDTCTRIQKHQTENLVGHLLQVDLSYFSSSQIGALNGRIHRSIEGLIRLVKLGFLDFLPASLAASFALLVGLSRDPLIGLAMLGSVACGIAIILWQVASQRGIRIGLLRDREKMDGTVVETLSGIETVRVLNTESIEIGRVASVAESLRLKEIRHHIQMALFDAVKLLTESVFHIATISVSVWFAISGRITIGEVLTYSMLYLSVAAPLRELHRILDEAHESTIRVQDLFALLDGVPVDKSFTTPAMIRFDTAELASPMMSFRDVAFSYPGSDRKAIDGVSFRIMPGEKVACVGRSGSGKSTLIKLMLRLMHHQVGEIVFCGRPIEEWSRGEIAERCGLVSQSPFVFSGTVIDNIAYGCSNPSKDEVIDAAKCAQIHDEIMTMGGYDSCVAEQGRNLSGGQRQRIMLARLFLRDPQFLILDEATASLDTITEARVQKALNDLMSNRAAFIVAHRLNTVVASDKVIVMADGAVVEAGRYEELIVMGGQLADLQLAG